MDIAILWSANGRIGRLTWWKINLLTHLAWFGIAGLMNLDNIVASAVSLVLVAVLLRIVIVTSVKRCHDHGWSGGWIVFWLIPPVAVIWFGLIPGKRGSNKYGEPESGSPFGQRSGALAQVQKVTR